MLVLLQRLEICLKSTLFDFVELESYEDKFGKHYLGSSHHKLMWVSYTTIYVFCCLQQFISNQNDDLKSYKSALLSNKQQKQSITELNKQTNMLRKQRDEHELKINELKQYDRRQNLELQGAPAMPNKDKTQNTSELANSLGAKLEGDISMTQWLPKNERVRKTRNDIKKHSTIIVRFVS